MPENNEEKVITVTMQQQEDFKFLVDFKVGPELLMDEPEPLGANAGPNAARVLSAAIANCLSASLLFCLQKSRVEIKNIRSEANTTITRNDKGRFRIKESKVKIFTEFDGETPERMKRCLDLFEDFCIVTASVRQGIPVQVEIEDQTGRQIYLSKNE